MAGQFRHVIYFYLATWVHNFHSTFFLSTLMVFCYEGLFQERHSFLHKGTVCRSRDSWSDHNAADPVHLLGHSLEQHYHSHWMDILPKCACKYPSVVDPVHTLSAASPLRV